MKIPRYWDKVGRLEEEVRGQKSDNQKTEESEIGLVKEDPERSGQVMKVGSWEDGKKRSEDRSRIIRGQR